MNSFIFVHWTHLAAGQTKKIKHYFLFLSHLTRIYILNEPLPLREKLVFRTQLFSEPLLVFVIVLTQEQAEHGQLPATVYTNVVLQLGRPPQPAAAMSSNPFLQPKLHETLHPVLNISGFAWISNNPLAIHGGESTSPFRFPLH